MVYNKPKTWRNISSKKGEKIKKFLLDLGGKEDKEVKGVGEKWRIRLGDSVFTFYTKGTLFVNRIDESFAQKISKILGQEIKTNNKKVLIGLDETGKGEILGHCVLCCVIVPSKIARKIDYIIGSANTKRRKSVSYWDSLFSELDRLKQEGLRFFIEKIPPWHVDRYNVNKIMDVVYQRLLGQITREVNLSECRIVIDDYGIGSNLSRYLEFLHKNGAEIIVESKADEKHLECRLASLISKWERERIMKAINKEFSLDRIPVGSGNAGDPLTKAWIEAWRKTGKPWPWFVKQSFRPIGKKVKKVDPPIRHELLSEESKWLFEEGKLSIDSLRIICPKCGNSLKSCKITPSENGKIVGRCSNPECNAIIENLNVTLLYYCGYIIPDSSVILAGVISKDLEKSRFFEGFTFVLLPEVRRECDSPGGKRELERLGNFASISRINLFEVNTKDIIPNSENLTTDEIIVEVAKRINAIVYTRDKAMYGMAISKNVFCLSK